MLIPGLGVVLLAVGLILRHFQRLPRAARGQRLWSLGAAFVSRRAYAIFVAGRLSIVAGALLVAIAFLRRLA